jgi:hypothetical protein
LWRLRQRPVAHRLVRSLPVEERAFFKVCTVSVRRCQPECRE